MIPQIGHVVWNHRQVLQSTHPLIEMGLHNLVRLNPHWKITLYTPPDIESDLQKFLTPYLYNLIKHRHFVSKIDLWRLFKMYQEGGLYMDIDKMVNVPLCDIIDPGIKWVLPTTKEYDFTCDVMISAPGNPAFKTGFEMYLNRVQQGWCDQYFLGPQTYMHAVSYTLLGEIVNTDPGEQKFQQLRDRIAQMPFVSTFREVPFDHMLLYRGDQGHTLELIKRDFYAQEGVKHWTGDW